MLEVVASLEIALASHKSKGRSQEMKSTVFQRIALLPKGMNRWWSEGKYNVSNTGPSKNFSWEQISENVIQLHCHFSLAEIQAATNHFDKGLLIGCDAWGNEVYEGSMDGGTHVVAIKKLWKPTSQYILNEVCADIQVHSLLQHPNIVSLIGFCNEKHELFLVYEYMGNGSLAYHLHGTDSDPLLWKKRLEICIDTARGLKYLHRGAEVQVIHCNVNPSNILLDCNWVAKVSDFTISILLCTTIESEGLERTRCGTFGYVDPEYFCYGKLTKKSEVFSFGVMLLEVLCAKKPSYCDINMDGESLLGSFKSSIKRGTIDQVIDPYLIGKIAPECLRDFVKISLSCLVNAGIQRPSMDNVLGSLQCALQLQEASEIGIEIGTESPVTDPNYYNDVFSADTDEFRIGGQTFLLLDFDLLLSRSSSSFSE